MVSLSRRSKRASLASIRPHYSAEYWMTSPRRAVRLPLYRDKVEPGLGPNAIVLTGAARLSTDDLRERILRLVAGEVAHARQYPVLADGKLKTSRWSGSVSAATSAC